MKYVCFKCKKTSKEVGRLYKFALGKNHVYICGGCKPKVKNIPSLSANFNGSERGR